MLTARGELIHEGSPVVLLHSPRADRGIEEAGLSYESILFVPAGEGKKISVGDDVELSPATVKREEHGYIKGKVAAISELPATRLAMETMLEHPQLVDAFLKRYAPGVLLRVDVKLKERKIAKASGAGPPHTRSWQPVSNGLRRRDAPSRSRPGRCVRRRSSSRSDS